MFVQNINPVLFNIGLFEIRYYGLIFALAFIAGHFFLKHLVKLKKLKLTDDDIAEYLVYLIIGSVLGARLFEILIYEPRYYFSNPFEMIAVWHGGLSVHGGIIGALIAGYFFTKKKKVSFWKIADITVIPLAFGLIFGRIANFTNSEFVGKITDVPWAVKFMKVDPDNFRHPVQLYEALKNALIFSFLWIKKGEKHKDGYFFWIFVLLYSILRFFIEFYKEWDLYYFDLAIPQIISIIFIIISLFMLFRLKKSMK